jgi:hypothetical protein
MRNLALLPVAVAPLVYEFARAMVRAYQLEDDFFDEEQQMRPPGSVRHVGGWRL